MKFELTLIAATNNHHKLDEIKEFLEPLGIKVIGLSALGITIPSHVEVFSSYLENAKAKCEYVSKLTCLPVLSDDSGLEIEALDGKPGILSARYSKTGLDEDNRQKVLKEMSVYHEKREAKFICVLCLLINSRYIFFKGESYGSILEKEEGSTGFGYDSLFFCPIYRKSYANLTKSEKLNVSHRGIALSQVKKWFNNNKIPKVGLEPTKGCPH